MSKDSFDIEHFPTNPAALRMMSRISPIYDRSYVGKWIFEVMGADMGDVRLRFEELRAQAFPETATWGLMYWEQRYGLPVGSGLSDIEARRRRVLGRRKARAPMNPKRVEHILSELTGREVVITENVADYTFGVEIRPGDNAIDIGEAMRRLKQIKPSHQAYRLQVNFQTTRVKVAALTETRLTVEVWPDVVTAVELPPARLAAAAVVWPKVTAGVLPGTVERISTTAGVAVGAAPNVRTTLQPWPETVRRAETTVEVAAGAVANVRTTAQPWPETVKRAETTAEAHVMAGTQQQTVTKVWPGAVEHVETKTGASGSFVEIHQTIEIWP